MDRDNSNRLARSAAEKLAQPRPLSNYQRDKNAQEAKKREEEAANAAVLKDFEASLGVEHDNRDQQSYEPNRSTSGRALDEHRRLYNNGNQYGGPRGGFDRMPPGAPPSMKRKRQLEDQREREAAYDDYNTAWHGRDTAKKPREEVRAEILYVGNLPPSTTPGQLKGVLSPYLNVQSVLLSQPSKRGSERRSLSATVTLATSTKEATIMPAIDKLRDHYIGFGYRMTVTRTAPSSKLHPALEGRGSDLPFGAKPVKDHYRPQHTSYGNARGRFAPPESYDGPNANVQSNEVDLDQGLDISELRIIHRLVDTFMSSGNHNRAMLLESLFMQQPEVQSNPKLAFLYDSRSPAGAYYRYCLWNPEALKQKDKSATMYPFSDRGSLVFRKPSSKRSAFNGLTKLAQAVDDSDYASSEEEGDGEEQQILPHQRTQEMRTTILPLHRARFAHLLARLAPVSTMLRRGDVARVTYFAISHAATGVDDIVDMLLLNITRPFSLFMVSEDGTLNTAARTNNPGNDTDHEDYDPDQPLPSVEEQAYTSTDPEPSDAMYVGLLLVTDILGAMRTAEGLKNAWQFRQKLEVGLKQQKVFEQFGRLDRKYNWGKMKTEKWRNKMDALFDIWSNSMCFGNATVNEFKAAFHHDYIEAAKQVATDAKNTAKKSTTKPASAGKIKMLKGGADEAVERPQEQAAGTLATAPAPEPAPAHSVSEPVKKAQDVVMTDSDPGLAIKGAASKQTAAAAKKRLRAEDMFADDDW